jgi:hypothetical protein
MLKLSEGEPHHDDAALDQAPVKYFDVAPIPAPALTLTYIEGQQL